MTRRILALIIAALLLCFSASAETVLTVRGTGETLVQADVAIVTLGVSTRNKDVQTAQADVNTAIAGIREALIAAGIASEDINTDYISVYTVYDYDYEQDKNVLTGYDASTSLAIRITDIDSVGTIIDLAFASGANTLSGISFSASDTTEAQAASLTAAVADARRKAEVLAAAAGLTLKEITAINEDYTSSSAGSVDNFTARSLANSSEAAKTVVQAAKLSVTASVTITFTAE